MKNIQSFEEFINEELDKLIESSDGLLDDVDGDDDRIFDIDIDLEDEEGTTLDDDPEETGEYPDELKARPPKLKKRQREANTVKSKVTRELLGPESKFRPLLNKIFKKVEMEIRREASKQGVPVGKINLDKLTIKR